MRVNVPARAMAVYVRAEGESNVKATGHVRGRAAGGWEVEELGELNLEQEAVVVLGRRLSVCVRAVVAPRVFNAGGEKMVRSE